MPQNASHTPGRWAVYRLGHLGDVVLTTGVLLHLGNTRGWRFRVITATDNAAVFLGHPYVDDVLPVGRDDLASFNAFARKSAELAHTCAGFGLLDLHGSLRSRLLAGRWQGPVRRYPKFGIERRMFLASGGRLFKQQLLRYTVPQRYCMAAENPPPAAKTLLPRIFLTQEERLLARERLDALFGRNTRPLALHPYATHALKSWPAEHWRALAARLDAKGEPWLVLGRGESLFPGRDNDISNRSSLRESCALLAECRALVTGDSGPMHLAEAVGTPVLVLFGPTTREWGFYPAAEHDIILERDLPCRPCSLHGKKPCPENGDCLASILPEDVLAALAGSDLPHG